MLFISMNVQKGRNHLGKNGALDIEPILLHNPDVLLLQEFIPSEKLLSLIERHGYSIEFEGSRHVKQLTMHMGNAIAYKRGAVQLMDRFHLNVSCNRLDRRVFLGCEFLIDGEKLNTVSVHFALLKRWRVSQWQGLAELLKFNTNKLVPTVIGGDFNCGPVERGAWARQSHFLSVDCGFTFPAVFPVRKLDAFLTHGVAVLDSGSLILPHLAGSDHRAIWSTVAL